MKDDNRIQKLLLTHFFSTASVDEVKGFLLEIFDSVNNIIDPQKIYNILLNIEIPPEVMETIIKTSEWKYISEGYDFLCQYLYEFYKKTGQQALEMFYFERLYKNSKSYDDKKYAQLDCCVSRENIRKYNNDGIFYTYQGEEKKYEIYSFSNQIGLNMTLLKTPYGAIIFDCGAKVETYGLVTITAEDIKNFLRVFDLTIDDVLATVISHAHLDHYGSIGSLVKAGIDKSRIYIENATKRLIADSTKEDYLINDYNEISSFYFPNKILQIVPFENGHILGSNGYVVSFDNQNVVYTGDFSLHDQPIVKGLNPDDIMNMESVRKHGISCLITETTYGMKKEVCTAEQNMELMRHFTDLAVANNYKVFIPSFAVGRSQEVAVLLKGHKIIMDGLAVKVTHTYEDLLYDTKIFDDNTHFASDEVEIKLHNYDLHDIIIASSGMIALNSTSYNYITQFLNEYDNVCIIRSGFMSDESIGAEMLNQWRSENNILLDIPISAHASKEEIVSLINAIKPENVVLIHEG